MNVNIRKKLCASFTLLLLIIVMILCAYVKFRRPYYLWYNTENKSSAEILEEVSAVNPLQKVYPTELPEDIMIYKIESRTFDYGVKGSSTYAYIYSDYSLENWQEYYENYTVMAIYGKPENGGQYLKYDNLRKAMLVYSPTVTSFVEAEGKKR